MFVPLLLCVLCVVPLLPSVLNLLLSVSFFFLGTRHFLPCHDCLVLFLRQHAHHGHHPHHSRAPIPGQPVGFRLRHDFIHAHFHERILREPRHAGGILCNGRRMHVLEGHAHRKRLHLVQGFCFRLIRGLD